MAKSYTLKNGKVVTKPRSWVWLYALIVLGLFLYALTWTPIATFNIRFDRFIALITQLFSPQSGRTWFDYFAYTTVIWEPFMETVRTAFAGTAIGAFFAIPFAVICARNIIKIKWLNEVTKFMLSLIRTMPIVILALFIAAFIGFGNTAGTIAVSIFSFGIMSKMLYEALETIDMTPLEALDATGARTLQKIQVAVVPQVMPIFLSYFIYILEINIRASIILAYVGAGGIGQVLRENLGPLEWYNRDRAGLIIILLTVVVLTLNYTSNAIRRKMQ